MKGSGKQYRTCWPGMLFFCCYWSLCDGEGFVNRSCWKIFEGAIFHQKMLEHLMWMSDFELTSSSRTDFRLAQFSILICLAWRDALPGFAYLEITLPCKLPGTGDGTVGSLGCPLHRQPADERVGYPKSIVTLVFSAPQLPTCQRGAWKFQGSLYFPDLCCGLDVWDLQCKALGSLQMQVPAQEPRNQLKWDLSCHKGPGCLKMG